MRVHLTFIITSNPEINDSESLFLKEHLCLSRCMRLFPSATEKHVQGIMKSMHWKEHFNLSCMCALKHFRIKVSRMKSTKADMGSRAHVYKCTRCVYGKKLGEKSELLTEMYYLTAIIPCNFHIYNDTNTGLYFRMCIYFLHTF